MSYNAFLDAYFSSRWIGYGVPLVVMLLLIGFRKKIYRTTEYTFWMRTINIAIPFVLAITSALINPIYWGYGPPQAIDDIRMMNGKLIVEDHILTFGSRFSSGDACSRVHVLDPATGNKELRFSVGDDASLVGMHGDSLCVSRYGDVAYFSVDKGNLFAVYNRETLPKYYAQLSAGVDNFMWGDGRNIMEISGNDGKNWNLYTQTGKIYSADKKTDRKADTIVSKKLYIHEREIRMQSNPVDKVVIKLGGQNENQHRMFLMTDEDSVLNNDLIFLDGIPVGLDLKDSAFFVLHFETLQKETFRITCMSLDGKRKLWEINQKDFNATYKYPEQYSPHAWADEKTGKLFFSIDKEIFAVSMSDGKLCWRTKL